MERKLLNNNEKLQLLCLSVDVQWSLSFCCWGIVLRSAYLSSLWICIWAFVVPSACLSSLWTCTRLYVAAVLYIMASLLAIIAAWFGNKGWAISTCEACPADRKILHKHFFTNSFARSLLRINHSNMCLVVSLGSEHVLLIKCPRCLFDLSKKNWCTAWCQAAGLRLWRPSTNSIHGSAAPAPAGPGAPEIRKRRWVRHQAGTCKR